jgi:hypothetical protein
MSSFDASRIGHIFRATVCEKTPGGGGGECYSGALSPSRAFGYENLDAASYEGARIRSFSNGGIRGVYEVQGILAEFGAQRTAPFFKNNSHSYARWLGESRCRRYYQALRTFPWNLTRFNIPRRTTT